jgi:hypothetical protein
VIIRVVGQNGESIFPFGVSGPWNEFRNEVISQGHEITLENFGTRIDAIICNRHSVDALKEADVNQIPISRRALVLWEPEIVEKERYSPEVLKQYGIVYAPSPIWAKKVFGKPFKWPQDRVEGIESMDAWLLRKKKFVVIQGNKFSARKGELYSLRRRVITALKGKIDLYGTDWDKGPAFAWMHWSMSLVNSNIHEFSPKSMVGIGQKFKSYFGPVTSKRETFLKYRYAIVIENSADFVSEKLFDAISAGCIVIYTGPNLKEFGIEDTSLILGPQKKSEILKRCNQLLGLSDAEQYLIAKEQNSVLLKISNDWENTQVLRTLATNILQDMR